MATSLLYLSLCLGPYSILVIAGSGGVYIYSYCSYYSCYNYYSYYRVAGAAIKVTNSTAIGTTYSTAVKIASGISRAFYKTSYKHFYGDSYCGYFY